MKIANASYICSVVLRCEYNNERNTKAKKSIAEVFFYAESGGDFRGAVL